MDKWDRAILDYLNADSYTLMTDLTQPTGFSFEMADNGICTIHPAGKISADLVSAVARQVVLHISEHGLPGGLLLDVRGSEQLSIVRLSSLVDTLSGMGVPLAVLFSERSQQMLADLLHNTLAQKDYIAYFTDPAEAHTYLLTIAAHNTGANLHLQSLVRGARIRPYKENLTTFVDISYMLPALCGEPFLIAFFLANQRTNQRQPLCDR